MFRVFLSIWDEAEVNIFNKLTPWMQAKTKNSSKKKQKRKQIDHYQLLSSKIMNTWISFHSFSIQKSGF